MPRTTHLIRTEIDMILAGLRLLQRQIEQDGHDSIHDGILDILTDSEPAEKITPDRIDELCELVNLSKDVLITS